jgi:mono/diheme cytochrome c family protein
MSEAMRMKTVLATVVAVLAVQALVVAAFIYSGAYNVAATDQHWSLTHTILEAARVRSIKMHAAGLKPPDNLDDHKRVVEGTSHFAGGCAMCHSAPGVEPNEIAKAMYPSPPVLTNAATQWTPGELFWIVRNGIKMSGMPAAADHSDDEIWSIVAFLNKLGGMSEQDYGSLVKESIEAGGGHAAHGGGSEDCAPKHRAAGHC